MALHKTNIYIDISGWAPRYIPTEVMRDMKGRLQEQFLFGSDYPLEDPRFAIRATRELGFTRQELTHVLYRNAMDLFGL